MAGDWIKMRCDLPVDPAVIAVAAELGLSEDEVVGKLLRLWSWANRQTTDGNAPSVTEMFIDRYIGVTGFANSLANVGWLMVHSGGITFPNFDRHMSQSAKRRALTAKRVAQKRNAPNVTSALPEKRREEKSKKKKDPPLPPFDPTTVELPFSSDPFRRAWLDFCEHRRKKHPLTKAAVSRILAKCRRWGESKAVASIDRTIEHDYRGLFEPREGAARETNRPDGQVSGRIP